MYIMVQNTKHRRNKRNKSVKKHKKRGGGEESDRPRHESRVDTDSPTRSNARTTRSTARKSSVYKISNPVPSSQFEKKINQMKTRKYDTEESANFQADLIIDFIKRKITELNNKGSWFNFTFQPQGNNFFLPKVSKKDDKYIIFTSNSYN